MRTVSRDLKKHLEGVVTATLRWAMNAGAESDNSKIQWIKRMACGLRNRDRFRAAIHFHLGGLDLRPEVLPT